ncbi:MAG: hypothetical protein E7345_05460 [Clostridiales bacterium]|nr:hypothetical protein [Clostridiales bacterium]
MKVKGSGLKIIGKKSVFIDKTVKLGKNVTIYPNNIIKGNTVIGDNVTLLPNNFISNCKIENDVKIEYSYLEDSVVGSGTVVGPYSRLRPNSNIGQNCKIGNFVEVKNSTLGTGTKASHLAYIGDADIGSNVNIGCGAIFVNYNKREKNRSTIGNDCFIGSNVNVIAPVNIADGTYVCAGTTITIDTKENDFVIGRSREVVKPNYAKKYNKKEDKK